MSSATQQSPVRLVAVATDIERAGAVARPLAAALGGDRPRIVVSIPDALALLRSAPIDALVAWHEPPVLDALTLARALRGAGDETPLVVLGHPRPSKLEPAAWHAGADEYACLADSTANQLAGRLRRAIDAREQLRRSRKLLVAEQQRLADEQQEANRLIVEQRRMIAQLSGAVDDETVATVRLSGGAGAEAAYADLVRDAAHGRAPTGDAVGRLADELAAAAVTGSRLMELHVAAVAVVTNDASPKAARVMRGRADRVLLDAIVHLAEAYRGRYLAGELAHQTPAVRAA